MNSPRTWNEFSLPQLTWSDEDHNNLLNSRSSLSAFAPSKKGGGRRNLKGVECVKMKRDRGLLLLVVSVEELEQ